METEGWKDASVNLSIQSNFELEELFACKSAGEWRAMYAGAYDWGADVGWEIVET